MKKKRKPLKKRDKETFKRTKLNDKELCEDLDRAENEGFPIDNIFPENEGR